MKRYWKYIKPYLPAFIIGPLMMIVEVIGEVVLPKLMANIINVGVANGSVGYITGTGALMILVALLMMAGGVGGAYFGAKAAVSFAADLRKDAFDKVQTFSFANLDQFSTGSLITRLTNDITQVQNLINMALRMMLRAPGMLIGALIMAFVMNAELAVIVLIVIPILVGAIAVLIKIAFPKFKIMQKKLDALNSNIQEMLTNVRVIKSFVRGDYEEKKFAASNEDLKQTSLGAFKTIIIVMPLMMLMMNGTTLAVVWFGGRQIIVGNMQVGDLTAFTTYIVQILMSLMMLAMVILQSSRALASLSRIREILDTEVDLNDEHCKEPDKIVSSGRVEFRDVSFRYYKENKEAVLSHISFAVKSGQTLGIIGSTGSGKTTLVQMIPRLYDVDEGEVLVDGVNVKDYTLENLREGVGMVLQKNVLFSGSILENLMWGDENASMEEVRKAAQAAQADGFVSSFTGGYEMHLLLREDQTAAYTVEIWKRFRKWGGIPTGITQNVKDLLASKEVENIFENSDFIYMLNQAVGDRQILAKQLNISPHQLSYVTHSGEGEGLLFYGNVILPFVDRFPANTELYRIMTTRLSEVADAKKEQSA